MKRYPKIVGYAAVWSAVSHAPRHGFYERFAVGAFSDSIRSDGIAAFWLHLWECELAFNRAAKHGGILKLREDGQGLAFEIEPREDSRWVDSAISDIRSGMLHGASLGYRRVEGCWDVLASGLRVYTNTRVELLEVSPVYWPLFLETSVRLVESSAPEMALASSGTPLGSYYGRSPYYAPYPHGGRLAPRTVNDLFVTCSMADDGSGGLQTSAKSDREQNSESGGFNANYR